MSLFDNIKNVFNKKEYKDSTTVDNKNVLDLEEKEPEIEIVSSKNYNSLRFSINFDSSAGTVKELIKEYRKMSLYPEIDEAITEIVNEAVVMEDNDILHLSFSGDKVKDNIQKIIIEEFNYLLSLLSFNTEAQEIFKQWYIDGRLYVQNLIDLKNPKKGIVGIKILSPLRLKRIREDGDVFFIYEDEINNKKYKIPEEHITFIHSKKIDQDNDYYISHLHKAIRPYNQLKLLEDSAVIYRFTRAPERRVFYIDVGKMNKSKAESYMASLMAKFKNRITYDSVSGKIDQRKNVMSMTEDFWIPSSESSGGSRGTKVDVLPSGTQLGEITDIEYFGKKLKKSLNIPISRFDEEQGSSLTFGNMNGEITREEIRFFKFISKLRSDFSEFLLDILRKQLLLKKIIDLEYWIEIKQDLEFTWNKDSHFTEIKNFEILKSRLEVVEQLQNYIGKYISNEYVLKNILKMSNEEIEYEQKKIEEESKHPLYKSSEEEEDY